MASSASLPAVAVSLSLSLLLPLLVLLSGGLVEIASAAAIHKVGDAGGWTTLSMPNYTAWALSKTFHVGDTLLFEYNMQYHNVEQVTRSDYKACNSDKPINVHTSGNDSIVLKNPGRYFFLCGFPTHCTQGQKVDVLVEKPSPSAVAASSPAGAPAEAPAPATEGGGAGGIISPVGASPTPAHNGAAAAAGAAGIGTVAAGVTLVVVLAAGLL